MISVREWFGLRMAWKERRRKQRYYVPNPRSFLDLPYTCPKCEGDGDCVECDGNGQVPHECDCSHCDRYYDESCYYCKGSRNCAECGGEGIVGNEQPVDPYRMNHPPLFEFEEGSNGH